MKFPAGISQDFPEAFRSIEQQIPIHIKMENIAKEIEAGKALKHAETQEKTGVDTKGVGLKQSPFVAVKEDLKKADTSALKHVDDKDKADRSTPIIEKDGTFFTLLFCFYCLKSCEPISSLVKLSFSF